jgi:hypothetical protein
MGSTFIWVVSLIAIIFFVVLLPFALKPRKTALHEHEELEASVVITKARVRDKWEHTEHGSQFKFPSHSVEYIIEFEREGGKIETHPVTANDYVGIIAGQEKYLTIRDGKFYSFADVPPDEDAVYADVELHPDAVFGEEHLEEKETETV